MRSGATFDPGNYTVVMAFFGADEAELKLILGSETPLVDIHQCEGSTRLVATSPIHPTDVSNQSALLGLDGPTLVQATDAGDSSTIAQLDVGAQGASGPRASYKPLYDLQSAIRPEEFLWNETVSSKHTASVALGVPEGAWQVRANLNATSQLSKVLVGLVDQPCFVHADGTLLEH